jgi:hypothetical protein
MMVYRIRMAAREGGELRRRGKGSTCEAVPARPAYKSSPNPRSSAGGASDRRRLGLVGRSVRERVPRCVCTEEMPTAGHFLSGKLTPDGV